MKAPSPKKAASSSPQTFRQLFDASWQLYTKYFWSYLGMALVSLLALVPLVIVILAFAAFATAGAAPGGETIARTINIALGFIGLLAMAFALYVFFLGQIGIMVQIKSFAAGKKASVWTFLKDSNRYFFSYLGLILLIILMAIPAFLLLVIPGVLLVIFITFAPWVLITEQVGPIAAIKGSFRLVANNFWHTLVRYYAPLIMLVVVLAIPTMFMAKGSASLMVYDLITNVLSFVFAPLLSIYLYTLYRDVAAAKK